MNCKEKACVFPARESGLCAFHERDLKEAQDSGITGVASPIYSMGEHEAHKEVQVENLSRYDSRRQSNVAQPNQSWARLKEKCSRLKDGEGFLVLSIEPEMQGKTANHFANNFRSILSMGMAKTKWSVRIQGKDVYVKRIGQWDDSVALQVLEARKDREPKKPDSRFGKKKRNKVAFNDEIEKLLEKLKHEREELDKNIAACECVIKMLEREES